MEERRFLEVDSFEINRSVRIRIYANLVSLVLVQPQLEKIALPQIRWVLLSDFAGDRTLSSCQEAIWSAVLEEVQRDAEVGLVGLTCLF